MFTDPRLFSNGVIWALLSLWLFFGSLAVTEQMNLLVETSGQDEEVLAQLESTPKSDSPTVDGRWIIRSVIATVTALPPLALTGWGFQSHWIYVHDHPTLRPHQRVSVYRI